MNILTAKILSVLLFSFLFACNTSKKNEFVDIQPVTEKVNISNPDTAYFAGGCFWCTEAMFERVKGVGVVISGYSGGSKPDPSYEEVAYGRTDYAETILVEYDTQVISYKTLTELFFGAHDPTQLNKQLPDIGKQYRSAIFYTTEEEKIIAETIRDSLDRSGTFDKPIVTEITAWTNFYEAEDYHQDFYERNPRQSYIVNVAAPKVEKFKKKFPGFLKNQFGNNVN